MSSTVPLTERTAMRYCPICFDGSVDLLPPDPSVGESGGAFCEDCGATWSYAEWTQCDL